MTKIKAITKASAKTLHEDITKALEKVAEKHGLSFQDGNMRYSSTSASMKFALNTISDGGIPETQELRALKMYHEELVGLEVRLGRGEVGKIVGYKTRAPKRPFIVEVPGGKSYVCPYSTIQMGLVDKKLAAAIKNPRDIW